MYLVHKNEKLQISKRQFKNTVNTWCLDVFSVFMYIFINIHIDRITLCILEKFPPTSLVLFL